MDEHDRIAMLDELEQKSERKERHARWLGWGSLAAAAVVLAILLISGGLRLQHLQEKVEVEQTSLQALAEEREQKLAELRETEQRLESLREMVGTIDKQTVEMAYEQKAQRSASPAMAPRVYVHIARQEDRDVARGLVRLLENEGFVVLGIEFVETSARLSNTQVRYSKEADRAAAERLTRLLVQGGLRDATTVYLRRYENDPKVRDNQFEVWMSPQPDAKRPMTKLRR
jgi:hypothetical protein